MRKSFFISCFTIIIGGLFGRAQTPSATKELISTYEAYTSLKREIIFLHTNKTHFLNNEQLGFKAYIIDKHSRKPAVETANLYVQLVDDENNVLKEQLLQVKKGMAHGTFLLDSLFKPKDYILKAFTNWSRNFDEPNTYEQVIRVVNGNSFDTGISSNPGKELNAIFQPEGGNFVANTLNSLGIKVIDGNGLGVSNLQCKLLDENDEVLKEFRLNDKGLSKILVTPRNDLWFRLIVEHQNKEYSYNLPRAKDDGLSIILTNRKNKVLVNLRTNEAFLPQVKKHQYRLAVHNGIKLKLVELPKFEDVEIAHNIPKNTLFSGINILTIFDETNLPIAERIYFNSDNAIINTFDEYTTRVIGDSIEISLNYNNINELGDLSVSILPETSISSRAHHNIQSFNVFSPHILKGVENATAHLADATLYDKDLDVVLLNQGWSAYDWANIIHFLPKPEFEFEKGIAATITMKRNKTRNFIAFPHQGIELRRFSTLDTDAIFTTDSLFPYQDDKLRISELSKKGDFNQPYIDGEIEFLPKKIPNINRRLKALSYIQSNKTESSYDNTALRFALPLDKKTIQLDEVVVSENKVEDLRLKNLIDFSFGDVTVFDEKLRKRWPNVLSFLQMQNGVTFRDRGDSITTNMANVYLDGAVIKSPMLDKAYNDLSLLLDMRTEDIDYIEVNRWGLGEGLRGYGGVIRIFTRSYYSDDFKKPYEYSDFEYPLTFNKSGKYAVPVYSSYDHPKYFKYGVVGWFANLALGENGEVKFKIPKIGLDTIKLNIQGVLANGEFISEERIIQLN